MSVILCLWSNGMYISACRAACGKSTSSKILQEIIRKRLMSSSILFIDIDLIAHEILLPNPKRSLTAYWDIVMAFSDFDILEDIQGSSNDTIYSPRNIDRRKLGDIIFKDPSKRKLLNSLTHPLITKKL
jgi:dephospho-CoA kinase